MAKVQKSLRIEEADAARVRALKAANESEAAAYVKVIRAGLDALEGAGEPAVVAVAERELIEALKAQVAEKDAQISRIQNLASAQAAAIAAEAAARAGRPRGLMGRVRALLAGAKEDGDGR